jgi:hypothetical protein
MHQMKRICQIESNHFSAADAGSLGPKALGLSQRPMVSRGAAQKAPLRRFGFSRSVHAKVTALRSNVFADGDVLH